MGFEPLVCSRKTKLPSPTGEGAVVRELLRTLRMRVRSQPVRVLIIQPNYTGIQISEQVSMCPNLTSE